MQQLQCRMSSNKEDPGSAVCAASTVRTKRCEAERERSSKANDTSRCVCFSQLMKDLKPLQQGGLSERWRPTRRSKRRACTARCRKIVVVADAVCFWSCLAAILVSKIGKSAPGTKEPWPKQSSLHQLILLNKLTAKSPGFVPIFCGSPEAPIAQDDWESGPF